MSAPTPAHVCPLPYSGNCYTGARWMCPTCGTLYVHVCDEAEGCYWQSQSEFDAEVIRQ